MRIAVKTIKVVLWRWERKKWDED